MADILIVEDEAPIRQIVRLHLALVGHAVREAEDAACARGLMAEKTPDLAVLDVMLPGEDGFTLGRDMIDRGIPVLYLTAKTAVADRVYGLTMGAQDYMIKPFEPAELLARVENILRRTRKEDESLDCGQLHIDYKARCAVLGGVWGYDYAGETRTVDVHVQRLRSKIGAEYIETVYKYGYRFSGGDAR